MPPLAPDKTKANKPGDPVMLGLLYLLSLAGWAASLTLTKDCSGEVKLEKGNFFCGEVDQILYTGFNGTGAYSEVTQIEGQCRNTTKAYSGTLAPYDEDLSIHIRGPFNLKRAAVYNLSPPKSARGSGLRRRSGHRHLHKAHKRAQMIEAIINGKLVSWEYKHHGAGLATPAPEPPVPPRGSVPAAGYPASLASPQVPPAAVPPASDPAAVNAADVSSELDRASAAQRYTADRPAKAHPYYKAARPAARIASLSPVVSSPPTDAATESRPTASSREWHRIAYYDAEKGESENMTFMGIYGGQGSGKFDKNGKTSLAYLDATGLSGSSYSQVLQDTVIPNGKEISIFSADRCDDSCGISHADDVALKGFAGANKVFLFRFSMPRDPVPHVPNLNDRPALWLLNGRIPRTEQYGSCSCWQSGCGEIDVFEVLIDQDTKCKSTFQPGIGGSSDYFARPVDGFVNVAVIFHGLTDSIAIRVLHHDFPFPKTLEDATVRKWLDRFSGPRRGSLFEMGGKPAYAKPAAR